MHDDTRWMVAARCRDERPELFFVTDDIGIMAARRVCTTCPVCDACLDYAVTHDITDGVWGGLSEEARRRRGRTVRRRLSAFGRPRRSSSPPRP